MIYRAIIVESCFINGRDSGNRDFRVLEIRGRNTDDVIEKVFKNKKTRYKNSEGDTVEWELIDIFQISKKQSKNEDMDEIIGFMSRSDAIFGKLAQIPPRKSSLKRLYRNLV